MPEAPIATTGGALIRASEALTDGVRYITVLGQLVVAAARMRGLAENIRDTYAYVGDCSATVTRLAETAAGLQVDAATVAEHYDAAQAMLGVLADAARMATTTAEMATTLTAAAETHEAEYGAVAHAAQTMPVDMGAASFYANQ